ncbi:adenine specific DNA methylase Mod [Ligilactobacillus murinus DSM 20452 = NBRC 14221]|uniref:Adenine specific DNA methylase Mod n=1 Tax=Ligilactobacillus murinus DSM 20452 = NBRC 14221 TaxID=1423772 RepID=A0A0R2ATT2_9LACO|nr:site-specific DNA-methyltransferase [Ligilactobacillus murinus]KRM70320.1 adenine specific DNA methylase Mod [Ligilactobacillus murinus DSM 20452 = NBRC 14221]
MSVEPKGLEHIRSVLEQFDNKYITDTGVLKRNNVIEDLDKYDRDLMTALLSDELIHDSYTEKIAGVEVFKLNQFIEMLEFKSYWEDSYTKYSNKIGLTAGGKFIDESADVVLDFPFKDTVLKAGMSKEDLENSADADEPFLNEVIAKTEIDELLEPKILVNAKKFDSSGGANITSISDDDNLIIKGNNLIALHSLKKRYIGKVKFIYIDPPYNTGNDSFMYNDRFSHASWLTFMSNRLIIAKKLLTDDGVIAIQTDYHENSYIRVLMDEIFGYENYVSEITVKMSTASGPKMANISSSIPKLKDSILIYKKDTLKINIQPYKPKDGWDKEYSKILMNFTEEDRVLLDKELKNGNLENTRAIIEKARLSTISKEYPDKKKDLKWLQNNSWRIVADKQNTGLDRLLSRTTPFWKGDVSSIKAKQGGIVLFRTDKDFGKDTRVEIVFANNNLKEHVGDLWTDISTSGGFSDEGGIKFPTAKKPEKLMRRLIEMFTKKGDLVLDFFSGSATTLAVAMKLDRLFLGIEQMDYIDNISVKRLVNVVNGDKTGISSEVDWQGGGSFVYTELMEKNQGYLNDLQKAQTVPELMSVYGRMKENADIDFRLDLDKFEKEIEQFTSLDDRRRELVRILDKNQLYYNYANIDDENVRDLLSDSDYHFNKSFYGEEGE